MQRNYRSVLAVLYDIHANLPALEAVLADARAKGATAFFLGGDLVGFGPFQRETFAVLREIDEPTICIRGNGERWLREPPIDRAGDRRTRQGARAQVLGRRGRVGCTAFRAARRSTASSTCTAAGGATSTASRASRRTRTSCASGRCTAARSCSGIRICSSARPGPKDNELVNPGSAGMPLDGDTRARLGIVGRQRLHVPPHGVRRRTGRRRGAITR